MSDEIIDKVVGSNPDRKTDRLFTQHLYTTTTITIM